MLYRMRQNVIEWNADMHISLHRFLLNLMDKGNVIISVVNTAHHADGIIYSALIIVAYE
jgi:hypothetical protein